jgi:hypothetical protein
MTLSSWCARAQNLVANDSDDAESAPRDAIVAATTALRSCLISDPACAGDGGATGATTGDGARRGDAASGSAGCGTDAAAAAAAVSGGLNVGGGGGGRDSDGGTAAPAATTGAVAGATCSRGRDGTAASGASVALVALVLVVVAYLSACHPNVQTCKQQRPSDSKLGRLSPPSEAQPCCFSAAQQHHERNRPTRHQE